MDMTGLSCGSGIIKGSPSTVVEVCGNTSCRISRPSQWILPVWRLTSKSAPQGHRACYGAACNAYRAGLHPGLIDALELTSICKERLLLNPAVQYTLLTVIAGGAVQCWSTMIVSSRHLTRIQAVKAVTAAQTWTG